MMARSVSIAPRAFVVFSSKTRPVNDAPGVQPTVLVIGRELVADDRIGDSHF